MQSGAPVTDMTKSKRDGINQGNRKEKFGDGKRCHNLGSDANPRSTKNRANVHFVNQSDSMKLLYPPQGL
jgi:hypothetical protein